MSLKPNYRVEYAKSNRASCRSCKGIITKDTPRIGKLVQADNFDGTFYAWHHSNCFCKKFSKEVKSASDIKGLETLRWEDQQKLKAKFGEGDGSVEAEEVLFEVGDVCVEYAASGRSACRKCGDKIPKDDVRLGNVTQGNWKSKEWFHVDCFSFPVGLECVDDIEGYENLDEEDSSLLTEKIEEAVEAQKDKKKKGKAGAASTLSKEEQKKANEEKKRVEKLWKLKDELERDYAPADLKRMLRLNHQSDKGGTPTLIERCADGMTNGAIPRCSVCKTGHLHYTDGVYRCHGHLSAWSKCTNVEEKVERLPWRTPDWEILEEEEMEDEDEEEASEDGKRSAPDPETPFEGWVVALVGTAAVFRDAGHEKSDLETLVEENGGQLSANVTRSVTIVITTEEEDKKSRRPSKLKTADKYEIPVHYPEYLDEHIAKIKKAAKDEPKSKRQKVKEEEPKKEEKKKKNPRPTKFVAPAVDGFFEECEQACIAGDEVSGFFSAILSRTDLGHGALGKNSFYVLQLVKKIGVERYWLFRRWGRVGTDGTLTFEEYRSKDKGIRDFEKVYLKFTGNEWEERFDFEKRPGKYFPVDIDYGQDEEEEGLHGTLSRDAMAGSSLSPRVAKLVGSLFDLEMFEETMKSMDMDIKEMPLGKLSKQQLQQGFDVLKEIKKLLKRPADDKALQPLLKDATNRFYTLIPHHFDGALPPIFTTSEMVREKIEHLEILSDMEVATNMLKLKNTDKKDPFLEKYKMLKNDISPLERESDEWNYVEQYLNVTCQKPKLSLLDVFTLSRHGEADRFTKFNDIEDRKLLWHGTRTAVYAAILSGGMKIMPHSGGRVGKGLYFADIVSKSASYCGVWGGGEGYLLLSEVALGRIHTINRDDPSIRKPPAGFDSVLATGTIMPTSKEDIIETELSISGHPVVVPQGKIIKTGLTSTFNHNEFLVYDEGQVHMKYLLHVRWN